MSSSDIIWQHKVGISVQVTILSLFQVRSRFRPVSVKATAIIENAYQEWIGEGSKNAFVDVEDSSINFFTMILRRKKGKSEVKIRRSYQDGFYLMYRKSIHQTQVHVKLNHLQVDNQVVLRYPCFNLF